MITFSITPKQQVKLEHFLKEQEAILVEEQKRKMNPAEWEDLTMNGKYPYIGAIGGGVVYKFTPTSIGLSVTVDYTPTGKSINLTDYDEW